MDIRTALATQGYAATRPGTAPTPKPGESGEASAFGTAAARFADTLAKGEEIAEAAMIGQADSQALVQALAQSELAIEAAVTVRDKVVEAYQEILRMPV